MTPGEMADAMHDEVIKNAWADLALVEAETNPVGRNLSEVQQTLVEAGMEAAYLNTLRMLIRRDLLKAEMP